MRKIFHENYFRKGMTKNIPRKKFFRDFGEKFAQMFLRKIFHEKKIKNFRENFLAKIFSSRLHFLGATGAQDAYLGYLRGA